MVRRTGLHPGDDIGSVLSFGERDTDVFDEVRRRKEAIAVISSLTCFFAFLGPEVFSEAARILNYTRMSNVFSALVVSFFVHKTFHLVVQNLLQKAFGKRNVLCARTSRIATDVVLFNVVGNHCRAYFVCERREQFRRFVGCVFV